MGTDLRQSSVAARDVFADADQVTGLPIADLCEQGPLERLTETDVAQPAVVTTSLAAYLRALTELSIVSVEQFSYSEFLMSLSDPTAYYAISMNPLDGIAAMEINPTIAFTIIDRMLGGSGRGTAPQRALTEIEQNVIDSVVKLILENLTETWRAVLDLQF